VTPKAPTAEVELRGELDRLAHEILPGGRRALDRLLPVFAGLAGGAAAVYLSGERGLRRESKSGDGDFQDLLDSPPDASMAFDGGVLTWDPPSPAGELPVEALGIALAIAAAAREVQLTHRLRQQDFAAKTRVVQLEALYDVGLAIASTLDFEQLCDEILMRAVSLLDARRAALYLKHDEEFRLHGVFGGSAAERIDEDDEELTALLAGEPRPNCCALPDAEHLFGVPILLDGEPKGILVVGDKESRRGVGPFHADDKRTFELLANQAAISLANAELHRESIEKERLQREVELASQIQRQILPSGVPDVPGFELAGWYRPARHIGGDYYDFFRLPGEGRLAIVVADVSGKGVPAALLVSTLHSSLRLLAEREGVTPALFERLNRHVLESSAANKFITLFFALLDEATGEVTYVNAGHNPAVVVRADGSVEELEAGGLPMGLLPEAISHVERIQLEPGDRLCLYSDGITEAESPAGEEFGMEQLERLLVAGREMGLQEVVSSIDRAVVEFAAGRAQGDDQTVVLLARNPLA
jgi:sigma-B regulation protein RsbU (phosphoserine phosphatase)